MPNLLYGSETWNCTQKQIAKMNGVQYRHLRTISGETWRHKISHVDLLTSVQFGKNQNFELDLSEDETKLLPSILLKQLFDFQGSDTQDVP